MSKSVGSSLDYSITPLGDCAAEITWGENSNSTFLAIQSLLGQLRDHSLPGIVAVVPAFVSVMVQYDPGMLSWERVLSWLEETANRKTTSVLPTKVVEIPVCYDEPYAWDLAVVAQQSGMTRQEVIEMHCSVTYRVRMIGFSPGFPYLEGLPDVLHTPRLATPRQSVPTGSVAIGGAQTGIYTLATPGGWNIIGRTPLMLFRPHERNPCLLQAGDEVRFVPISGVGFEAWCRQP